MHAKFLMGDEAPRPRLPDRARGEVFWCKRLQENLPDLLACHPRYAMGFGHWEGDVCLSAYLEGVPQTTKKNGPVLLALARSFYC